MLRDRLQAFIGQLTKQAALAVTKYGKASGEDPLVDMPELFMPSFVLDRLDNRYTMTIETSVSKLLAWDADAVARLDSVRPESRVFAVDPDIRQRVDLVVFSKDDPDPTRQSFLALVEFKRYWLSDDDYRKMRSITARMETCHAGVICCVTNANREAIAKAKALAEGSGDYWAQSPVLADGKKTSLTVMARAYIEKRVS